MATAALAPEEATGLGLSAVQIHHMGGTPPPPNQQSFAGTEKQAWTQRHKRTNRHWRPCRTRQSIIVVDGVLRKHSKKSDSLQTCFAYHADVSVNRGPKSRSRFFVTNTWYTW